MMWTAIVPLKSAPERKSRLAARLPQAARIALSEQMAAHVLQVLDSVPAIGRVIVLSPIPVSGRDWRPDRGRGLNVELEAARADLAGEALLVMHADLPLLTPADVAALIGSAGQGAALAPDRHGQGTNSIAASPCWVGRFAFGPDSLRLHLRATPAQLVSRSGLMLDIDTPEDLDEALRRGWRTIVTDRQWEMLDGDR
ncbi:2-phospho-L-lactate guanylyltransferase [Sphingomonas sp. AOB5]|uniref:2-phospho-L-lactate guanylyltransferase n=1 Tax=Sphingomonas sp. AOB5 TaxID=3034017 RepID=UPI0023F8EA3B|nr:2-phospho-L-lactate guanylyltransferase [Sphingomonas sp. AOB5]MDF7774873.1 2-phospho-L-lactate guanylyltransferase [Sphingomonas sp. AOB5]